MNADEQGGDIVRFELPPRAEFVGTSRMVVASLARHYGFEDEQVEDLKVAVSEAVTNSVQSRGDAGSDDPIMIEVWMEDDALNVAVSDAWASMPEEPSATSTPPTGDLVSGLGLTLIRTLVTETSMNQRPGGGTTLTMTMKLEGSD